MSINKKKYNLEIINSIEESHDRYEVLINKTKLTYEEQNEKQQLGNNILQIKDKKGVIKHIPSTTISSLNKVFYKYNEYVTGLDFTPEYVRNQFKTYSNDAGNSLIVKHNNNISNNMIIGVSKTTKGVNDDVTDFNGNPNLCITRQVGNQPFGGFIHSQNVGDEYVISFEFSLSRFPSKVYQDSSQAYHMKQITTRISELIRFEFGDGRLIEFAAMAPTGVGSDKSTPKFKNRYSPFSIAVSFPYNKVKHSIHTDYKFELKKSYLVKLVIKGNFDQLSYSDQLIYKLYVNEVQQQVVSTRCKVWGKYGKNLKQSEIIPSQPGFLTITNMNYLRTQFGDNVSLEYVSHNPNNPLDFNTLVAIYSVPYSPVRMNNQSRTTLFGRKQALYDKIYSKYLHKANAAVDFGKINIFYLPISPVSGAE